MLNIKSVQNYAKDVVVKELRSKLNTDLDIKNLYFQPFNTVGLDSVYINDREGNKILVAESIMASIDLYELCKQNIVISTARLSDFEIHLSKQSQDSLLNIQFIIDAFASKEKKSDNKIDVQVNAINVLNGSIYYDIHDKGHLSNRFDKNHIAINNFHAKVALKSLQSDSLNLQVRKLGLKEKSGFEIANLVGRLVSKDEHFSIKGFELLLPDSKIEISKLDLVVPKKERNTSVAHSHDDDIQVDFELRKSYINPQDLVAIVPALNNLNDKVFIEANISGYEHNLALSNLLLSSGNRLKLKANAEIIDLFNEGGDAYLLATIDELKISGQDIENIANGFSSKKVNLPKGIISQENILFQGDISGYLTQLTAFGSLDTDDGIIRTDVVFGFNKKDKLLSFAKGKIYTTDFQLGRFLSNDNLGNISFNIALDIKKPLYQDLEGTIQGTIHDFYFKDYVYNNAILDITYSHKKVDGALNIDSENGNLSLIGMLDISNKILPRLDFKAQARNIQLDKLHLAKNMDNSYLSFNIDANFEGSNIDNAQGYITLDSLEFIKDQQTLDLDKLLVKASGNSENKDRRIEVQSDILSGYIYGENTLLGLDKDFKHTLNQYLPALLPNSDEKPQLVNNFKFHFDIANTEEISDILKLPVTLYQPATVNGFYSNDENKFRLEVRTPQLKAGGTNILSGLVEIENNSERISSSIKALVEGKNQILNDIVVTSLAENNQVHTSIELSNNSKTRAEGSFNIHTLFNYLEEEQSLETTINIDESKLLLNNEKWSLKEASIIINKGLISINNLGINTENKKQELLVHGNYSISNPSNILKAQLKDIDLSYVFETLAIDALKFGGAASGNVFLSSIEEKPYLNTRLQVSDFKFQGTELGNLELFSELDDETHEVMMKGSILSKENKKTTVDGTIDPVNQKLSIHFDADSVDIGFLHAYAGSIFDKVSGRGTGQIHLHGDFSNVTVEGVANIKDGKIGIKFLNTDYTFSDVIYLKEGLIYFNDIAFKDEYGNIAYGNGKVVHDYFQNIMYHIELDANKFLVYNATEAHNPIFYGKVFGSGKGILGGDEEEVNIDIHMQTNENTLVRMNFMEDEISEYSFISYVEPEPEETDLNYKKLQPIKTSSDMNINMNFYIDATPDATFELVMDPVGGDILRGSGSGAMQFVWSSKLEPQLYGNFNVNRGSYNFTFQRIMEKKFTIQDGSTVQFRGDPFQALLNVNAIYKVTASLSDLDKSLVEQTGQASVPVYCVLNLTGPLRQPDIKLDIDFPTTNEDVARQIKSLMDTEDMINRQIVYLLLLSKFYTPDAGRVDHPSSDFAVVASATLSNQLTKIISQIDNRWQLGTHIRLSDADMHNNTKEIELLLSSQLLNDRLLINGNFGYRDNPFLQKDAVITDIDIEYLLNKSGTWRIKAYNRYNEKYYYLLDSKGIQTQGIGLIYRKNFDKIGELFPWYQRRRKTVPSDTTLQPILPDSLKKGSQLSDFVKIKK